MAYTDQDDLGDVLTSAAKTYGDDAVLALLKSAEATYKSGKDVGFPGLTKKNPGQAASIIVSILDEHKHTSKLDGPTASSIPIVALGAPAATVAGGPIRDNYTWQMTVYAHVSKCFYWLNLIQTSCAETDRVRVVITDDPGVYAGRIGVKTFSEKSTGKIWEITVLSWVFSPSGVLLSPIEAIFHGYPVSTGSAYASHPSQKGKFFYFQHRVIMDYSGGEVYENYKTANAYCSTASTPICKW